MYILVIIIVYSVLIITGDAGEVCSEEVFESQNVTKSFVPQLTSSKSDFKGNQDHLDKQQPPKVMYLVAMMGGGGGGGRE